MPRRPLEQFDGGAISPQNPRQDKYSAVEGRPLSGDGFKARSHAFAASSWPSAIAVRHRYAKKSTIPSFRTLVRNFSSGGQNGAAALISKGGGASELVPPPTHR